MTWQRVTKEVSIKSRFTWKIWLSKCIFLVILWCNRFAGHHDQAHMSNCFWQCIRPSVRNASRGKKNTDQSLSLSSSNLVYALLTPYISNVEVVICTFAWFELLQAIETEQLTVFWIPTSHTCTSAKRGCVKFILRSEVKCLDIANVEFREDDALCVVLVWHDRIIPSVLTLVVFVFVFCWYNIRKLVIFSIKVKVIFDWKWNCNV